MQTENNIPPIVDFKPPPKLFIIDKKGDKYKVIYFNNSHKIVICENEKGKQVNIEFNQVIDFCLNPHYIQLLLEVLLSYDYAAKIAELKAKDEKLYNLFVRVALLTPHTSNNLSVNNLIRLLKNLEKGF